MNTFVTYFILVLFFVSGQCKTFWNGIKQWKLKPNTINLQPLSKYSIPFLLSTAITLSARSFGSIPSVQALDINQIGDIPTSGFIFKDSLKVISFKDPQIPGITIYLSDFDRPITEKLSSNFFDDPSSTSVTCAQTGPITIGKGISLSKEGNEIFEENRNLFFKQIHIRRVIDQDSNTVVYVSYSTRFNKGEDQNKSRFKSSLCAVHVTS